MDPTGRRGGRCILIEMTESEWGEDGGKGGQQTRHGPGSRMGRQVGGGGGCTGGRWSGRHQKSNG